VMSDDGGLEELLAQMQQLQSDLADAEAKTAGQTIVGRSGGGAVRVELSGEFSFDAVKIDPDVVAAGDVSMLEDLVLAAIRDGVSQLLEARNRAMGSAVNNALSTLFTQSELGLSPAEDETAEDAADDEDDE
jgi:nucleoid-associated protein EbfC